MRRSGILWRSSALNSVIVKDIQKYILMTAKGNIERKKALLEDYRDKKEMFEKMDMPLTNAEEGKERLLRDDGKPWRYLLPNIDQRKEIDKMVWYHYDMKMDSLIERKKYTVLSELDFFKSEWLDIWVGNELHFKEDYLKGLVINYEYKEISFESAMMMFAKDISIIYYYDDIKKKIERLENDNINIGETSQYIEKINVGFSVMMLSELGFFELDIFKNNLSERDKGKLINKILGINKDDTRKYITGLNGKSKTHNPLIHKELCKEEISKFILG